MSQSPTEHNEETNAKILAVSEDRLQGFFAEPFAKIAEMSDLSEKIVIERISSMLASGTIRRVRQTFLANKLAEGALAAWRLPTGKVEKAFEFMAEQDPFSGHVVLRTTDKEMPGADYRLWTTLKVPRGESLQKHAELLARLVEAEDFHLMPAKGIFSLGVGHVRRRKLKPGARAEQVANMIDTKLADISEREWRVILAVKDELKAEEISPNPWRKRAETLGMTVDELQQVMTALNKKGVVGRFSTFLEHVKKSKTGQRVTRFNALFHWRVPKGEERRAGGEIGRHLCLTHCYWREGGAAFGNVNIMGVAHGLDRELVLDHKAAIDAWLKEIGIDVLYTNVFWGGRSRIKPSEISNEIFQSWHTSFARK